MSGKVRYSQAFVKYCMLFWWFMKTVTPAPPRIPQASDTIVRKNSIAIVEKIRGVTSLRIGSTPSARIASICSVTTINPSSDAIELEFRPATMIPVSIGPSSRIIVSATNSPVTAVAPKVASVLVD